MGRTIGRFKPPGSPQHDFEAECDICGVVWPRSKLRMDGEGNLVCPDEGRGLDAATLNEMNARAVERLNQPYASMGGRPAGSSSPYSTSPASILGTSLRGWWDHQDGLKASSNEVTWKNLAGPQYGGLLKGFDVVPALTADGLVFAGEGPISSSRSPMFEPGDSADMWGVVALGTESEAFQEMVSVTASDAFGLPVAGFAIGRYRPDVSSGAVYGWAKFGPADPGQYVLAPRTDSAQHIYRFQASSTGLTLSIDDAEYTAAPSYTAGLQVPLGAASVGLHGYGTWREVVVSK